MGAAKRLRGPVMDRRGAATLEFAIICLVFLTVVLGVAEIGTYSMLLQALTEAVHVTGRFAVIHGASSSAPATAASLASLIQNGSVLLNPNLVSVTVTFTPDNNPGSTVSIVATYPWTPFAPTLINFPGGTIAATSASTILH